MASRRRAREFALQALFEADLVGRPVSGALNDLWSGLMEADGIEDSRQPESEEMEFAQRLAYGVEENKEQLDALLEEASTNWRLSRMPVVDRNILRLAAFELSFCNDIPANVSVNEAVELAKRFGSQESRAFVNGIVDRVGRHLGRLDPNRPRTTRRQG